MMLAVFLCCDVLVVVTAVDDVRPSAAIPLFCCAGSAVANLDYGGRKAMIMQFLVCSDLHSWGKQDDLVFLALLGLALPGSL